MLGKKYFGEVENQKFSKQEQKIELNKKQSTWIAKSLLIALIFNVKSEHSKIKLYELKCVCDSTMCVNEPTDGSSKSG